MKKVFQKDTMLFGSKPIAIIKDKNDQGEVSITISEEVKDTMGKEEGKTQESQTTETSANTRTKPIILTIGEAKVAILTFAQLAKFPNRSGKISITKLAGQLNKGANGISTILSSLSCKGIFKRIGHGHFSISDRSIIMVKPFKGNAKKCVQLNDFVEITTFVAYDLSDLAMASKDYPIKTKMAKLNKAKKVKKANKPVKTKSPVKAPVTGRSAPAVLEPKAPDMQMIAFDLIKIEIERVAEAVKITGANLKQCETNFQKALRDQQEAAIQHAFARRQLDNLIELVNSGNHGSVKPGNSRRKKILQSAS